ncbi:MAG: class I SAM-dependent methyltransferase [Defluviitaleaceae bacterium]|nr:class I SAM-dependent methyltransferase [Defluviitaleaceae bacterium]
MSEAYRGFASVYDALMTNAPYDDWAAYINMRLEEVYGGREKKNIIVLDLACGTGNITLRMAKMGYDMLGVDISEDMLAEASRKACEHGASILFLSQDMRELNLYGTVDAAICVCDGMSYILEERELSEIFGRVRLFLNSGGIFIFDMNTEYKFKELYSNFIFEGDGENGELYEWQNKYESDTKINEYQVVFHGSREPFMEIHRQRAYAPQDVCKMLAEAGFASVETQDGYSDKPLTPKSERAVYVARA